MSEKPQSRHERPREAATRPEALRVMMVVRLANGFVSSVANGAWAPSGSPAIAKLIQRLDSGPEELRLVLTRALAAGDDPAITGLRALRKPLSGLRTQPTILVEGPRSYSGPGFWLREILHGLSVWRAARRFRPDIIYIDRSNVLTGALLARFGKTPVVLRLLGVPPELRKILRGKQLARRAFRWAYASPFAHVISTLEGSRVVDFMSATLDDAVPRSVMLNGVDQACGEKAQSDVIAAIPKDRVVAMFLGRIEALKGAELFVDALLAAIADNVRLIHGLIVGDGALLDDLKARVTAAGASERVTFTGPLPHDQVARLLARGDIYVSLNRQGHLSNATLEAMAYAVPTVIQEIADPGGGMDEFASLVPRQAFRAIGPGAGANELADVLTGLAKAPRERASMAKALKAFAEKNLTSWDERIEREVALLQTTARAAAT